LIGYSVLFPSRTNRAVFLGNTVLLPVNRHLLHRLHDLFFYHDECYFESQLLISETQNMKKSYSTNCRQDLKELISKKNILIFLFLCLVDFFKVS
jgi:hypothetical protein